MFEKLTMIALLLTTLFLAASVQASTLHNLTSGSAAPCTTPGDSCCVAQQKGQCGIVGRPPGTGPDWSDGSYHVRPTIELHFKSGIPRCGHPVVHACPWNRFWPNMTIVTPFGRHEYDLTETLACKNPDQFMCHPVDGLDGPLEIHTGNFCNQKKIGTGWNHDNLWVRYQGDMVNVPQNCLKVNDNSGQEFDERVCVLHISGEQSFEWWQLPDDSKTWAC